MEEGSTKIIGLARRINTHDDFEKKKMSQSSTTSAAQPSVSDIQKVYQLVEEEKNVNALKECDKMLEKYPESNVFLSFKALTLMNMGKRKESIQIIDDILAQKKVEFQDFILRTLSIALERVHDFKRIAELYEKVNNAIPVTAASKFESLIEKCFYSFVRSNQIEKQQTTAAKLSRAFPDNPLYPYWNTCSMLLLRNEKPLLFKLAQKVLEKEFTLSQEVKKLPNVNYSERLRLYIENVLAVSGEYEAIINLIINDEPWGKELEPLPFDRKAMLAGYCLKVEKYYTLANGLYVYLLEKEESDEWPWWLGFIKSVLLLNSVGQTSTKSIEWNSKTLDCHASLSEVHTFIKSLQKGDKRGPYLAELEFMKEVQKNGLGIEFEKKPEELLQTYFTLFGSRKICYDDLKVYIELVQDKKTFLSNIYGSISGLKVNEVDRVEFATTFFKIQRHTLENVCTSNEDELIALLISEYVKALPLGKDLNETENQYGDEILLIASHYLLDKKEYVSAAILLENALKRSKYNYHFKVTLVRVYAVMKSLSSRAYNIFMNDMDVKHIQFESISYIIYHDLMKYGISDRAVKVAEKVLQFYEHEHCLYTSQYLALPYQKQSWSKIGEMTNFNSRLDNSHQIAKCQIDRLYLNLVYSDVHSARDIIEYLNMYDLDDFIYNTVTTGNKAFSHNEDTSILKYFGNEALKNNVLIPDELVHRCILDESFAKIRIVEIISDYVTSKEAVSSKPPVLPPVHGKKKRSDKEVLEHEQKVKEHARKVESAKKVLLKLKEKTESLLVQIEKQNLPEYLKVIVKYTITLVSETPNTDLLEEFTNNFEAIDALQHKDDLVALTRFIVWDITFFQFIYTLLKDLGAKSDKKYGTSIQKLKSILLSKASQLEQFIKDSRKETSTLTENTANNDKYFKPLFPHAWETTEKEVLLDLNQQAHKGGLLNTKVEQIVANMVFQYNK